MPSRSPALTASALAMPTTSPGPPCLSLVVAPPWIANSEPARCGLPSGPWSSAPSASVPPNTRAEREPADRGAVRDLEHFGRGAADAEPLGGRVGRGGVVAQRLEQPAHAEAVESPSRSMTGTTRPVGGLALEVAEHGLEVGLLVGEQLLEQVVVVVGELLEHAEARGALALLQLLGDRHLLGRLAGADTSNARSSARSTKPITSSPLADRDLPRRPAPACSSAGAPRARRRSSRAPCRSC